MPIKKTPLANYSFSATHVRYSDKPVLTNRAYCHHLQIFLCFNKSIYIGRDIYHIKIIFL